MASAPRAVPAGLSVVAGAALLAVVFDGIVYVVFSNLDVQSNGEATAVIETTLGFVFVLEGLRSFAERGQTESEGPRERLERLARRGFLALALVGLAVQAINIDALMISLSGVHRISYADISSIEKFVVFVYFIAFMLLLYWLPVVLYLVMPQRTERGLRRANQWFSVHHTAVETSAGLIIGGGFLYSGLSDLL
jgi:uncharacterized membrane protein YidH (DUF202 family)